MNYYPDAKILAEQRFGFGPRLGQQTVPLANQLDETGYIHPASQTLPTTCLLYTSPSPRDNRVSRMPSSA